MIFLYWPRNWQCIKSWETDKAMRWGTNLKKKNLSLKPGHTNIFFLFRNTVICNKGDLCVRVWPHSHSHNDHTIHATEAFFNL